MTLLVGKAGRRYDLGFSIICKRGLPLIMLSFLGSMADRASVHIVSFFFWSPHNGLCDGTGKQMASVPMLADLTVGLPASLVGFNS